MVSISSISVVIILLLFRRPGFIRYHRRTIYLWVGTTNRIFSSRRDTQTTPTENPDQARLYSILPSKPYRDVLYPASVLRVIPH